MTDREELKNNIMIKMRFYIDTGTMDILGNVLAGELKNIEIIKKETLPAAADDTNRYLIEFFRVKKAHKLSEATVKQYIDSIERLILYANMPLTEVTSMDIESYLESLRPDNSHVSLNNQRRYISAFYTFLRRSHFVMENPCENIEAFRETEKPIDHMQAEEVEQLKTGCRNKRDRALMEFLRCTAMRAGEIPLVKVCDVDWRSGKILIFGKKGGKYRTVCLDSVAVKYLHEYIGSRGITDNSSEPLFTQGRGGQHEKLGPGGIRVSVKAIRRRSGLERNVYPHLFRKTTATNIIRRGGSEEEAGEYLGHAPRNVTGKHYTFKGEEHAVRIFENYVASY